MLTLIYIALGLICTIFILMLLGQYTFWLPHRSWRIPRILMLHQVTSLSPASGMNMQPQKFEQLLKLLQKKKFTTVTMSEWLKHAENPNGQRIVALTFDDGFLDNFTEAFPLLEKYQAKATIYIAPNFAIEKMKPEHITQMSKSGLVEFGAHTMTHPNLNKIDDEQAMQEMIASKQWVESLLGSCENFAYPFGRFSPKHMEMAREAGFTSAVSTKKRIETMTDDNKYRLPRISISGKMNSLQLRIALRVGRYKL